MFNTDANVPPDEIRLRIERLQAELQALQIDGALILQNSDLYYLSGTIQQSHLYVPAEGRPLLMARKSLARARAESPIEDIVPLTSPKQMPGILQEHGLHLPGRLGMELDVLPVNLFRGYELVFEGPDIMDISPVVRTLRAVKSEFEIAVITKAAGLSDQLTVYAGEILKPGMTELEAAGLIEAHARKLGHQGIIRMRLFGGELFYGHFLCGASAAVPSYMASPTGGSAANPAVAQGAGFTVLAPDAPILLDYAFALNGYLSDHTRIFALESLPEDLMAAHGAMLDIQSQIMAFAKPGVTAGEVYDLGLKLATAAGYSDHFMGAEANRIQFIGHGVGLELDEYPFLAKGQEMVLAENMVIALEPKLIFPGRGVVGIENTHVVTREGLKQLGRYPDEVTII
ncbi:MAG: Xaa-Pro peptidase family protein [Desulfobacteraceae bacterium]